jgi:hypothetical protein
LTCCKNVSIQSLSGDKNMKHRFKLLLTSAALITPSVFGDSSAILREESSARFASGLSSPQAKTEVSFHSCASLSSLDDEGVQGVEDPVDSSELYHSCIEFPKKESTTAEAFQTALSQYAGTAAYKAMYPTMKKILWVELNKLLNGTGMVALTADGQKLPVVRGTFDGLLDLILNSLGVNSSIRSGVNLATTISGHKTHIESALKRLLGINSLEALVERLAQETVLRSMGLAIDPYQSTAKVLTLAEIGNVQQSVSLADDRAEALADRAANADLNFATGYVWYELRNMINKVASAAIDNHLVEARTNAIRVGKEKLDMATMVAAGGLIGSGATGLLTAAGLFALNHQYGDVVATAAYDAFNHVAVDGLVGVRNIAVLPISAKEIKKYHSVAVTVKTIDIEDDMVEVLSVDEKSFGGAFISGTVSNAVTAVTSQAVDALRTSVKAVSALTRGFSSWWAR